MILQYLFLYLQQWKESFVDITWTLIRPNQQHVRGEFLFRTYQALGVREINITIMQTE